MAKIQSVWALDIGQAALKALKLVPAETPDTVTAEAFDFVEYPKILSQPDADPEQLVREALATFMDRNDLKGCKVAIAVPGQAGLVKFIKLPPVEKKRIPDIVKFEAKQQIPFALEEVVWDYQQIGGDEEESDEDFTMAEVGLFAMKRDQINRAILPFRVAGIEVDIVQMGPIALFNYIAYDQLKGLGDKAGSIVLLDMGADNTDLVITDGIRIWQRNVPIGGNHFTRALTKELKQTFAKAEHLKRNATKAPDPRQIFTAMRGVFNDYASEINRSIGFYSSVNRTAKITKVVGLGNGFKLPGLQKFLQQNLSNEVEKLESFQRLVGDEVKNAPQFQENLPSFGVAYGLALQGLRLCPLKTNLLPPEIEQVRMIRRKKPWALAASALLMLGFSGLFLGDWKALAKVSSPAFDAAVKSANATTAKGAAAEAAFNTSKGEWDTKKSEGDNLVVSPASRGFWPQFLKLLGAYLPDPIARFNLNPAKNPMDQIKADLTRVHIDAIKPVYRKDLAAEWFNDTSALVPAFKQYMHPYDRETAPAGEGWVIQVVGHHYNPTETVEEKAQRSKSREVQYKFGPRPYLQDVILPTLQAASIRQQGVHHVALAWLTITPKWTTEQSIASNGLASGVPIMQRASAPAGGAAGFGGEGGGGGGGGGYPTGGGRGAMMPSSGMPSGGGGYPTGGGRGAMMGDMGMGMGGVGGAGAVDAKNITTLTRTDFLIQFVYQPPTAENPSKTLEEIKTAMDEAGKTKGTVKPPTDEELIAASSKATQQFIQGFIEAQKKAQSPGGDAPAAAPPAAAPGPGAATPPTPK